MSFLLARGTAIEWLRSNHESALFEKRYRLRYSSLEASRTRLERHANTLAHLTKPLQVAVWLRENRRYSALVQSHVLITQSGWYPCYRITPGVYCLAPEYVFLQMAKLLDEERLRFLGMELCGRYGIDGEAFLRRQTCSSELLLAVAEKERGIHGRKRALAVAPLVLDGAASPMEIALALILSSTREEGGFGLPRPKLNQEIPVIGAAGELWDDNSITPDMLWETIKLVIEYDSTLHHSASKRIARDARRRDVLEELGYRVITVTTEQMGNYLELERIAKIVGARYSMDVSPLDDGELQRRLGFQQRMIRLATNPRDLLGFREKSRPKTQAWHVRKR